MRDPVVLYQVDFSSTFQGKHISPSKQQVRFEFGIADVSRLRDGYVGVACRGEEHSVEFVWSLTSGKHVLIYDNENTIYFVKHKSGMLIDSKFEHLFYCSFKGQEQPAICKLIAHPFTPSGLDGVTSPGRRFDFLVNGQSFFDFEKLYGLGMNQQQYEFLPSISAPPMRQIHVPTPHTSIEPVTALDKDDDDETSVFAFARPKNALAAPPPTWDDYNNAYAAPSSSDGSNITQQKKRLDSKSNYSQNNSFEQLHSNFRPTQEEEEEVDLIDLNTGDDDDFFSAARNTQQSTLNQPQQQVYSYPSMYSFTASLPSNHFYPASSVNRQQQFYSYAPSYTFASSDTSRNNFYPTPAPKATSTQQYSPWSQQPYRPVNNFYR